MRRLEFSSSRLKDDHRRFFAALHFPGLEAASNSFSNRVKSGPFRFHFRF